MICDLCKEDYPPELVFLNEQGVFRCIYCIEGKTRPVELEKARQEILKNPEAD